MFWAIILFAIILVLNISVDWLIYKNRGRVKPDDPTKEDKKAK
jgi:hypothetical protein